ncbi:hypothetical protein EC973_006329 [Apophysomyces ossiformis]|uniref:PHD-type domain-containing protein n=1 Tax=Apophysomyces ossiformis TaxID=679940 RepID=A0A8H7BVT8_9FUNG|nr:hypothetical protein EC973_006329 [Apophysomyces ossiformis]
MQLIRLVLTDFYANCNKPTYLTATYERTLYTESVIPLFKRLSAVTKLTSFACKLTDGIGVSTLNEIESALIESSGVDAKYGQSDGKETEEDTLKLIEYTSLCIQAEKGQYQQASYHTFGRRRVFGLQYVGNKSTLLSTRILVNRALGMSLGEIGIDPTHLEAAKILIQNATPTRQPPPSKSPLTDTLEWQHMTPAAFTTPLTHQGEFVPDLDRVSPNKEIGSTKLQQESTNEQTALTRSSSVTQVSTHPAPQLNPLSAKRLPLRKRLAQKDLLTKPSQVPSISVPETPTTQISMAPVESYPVSDSGETTETDEEDVINPVNAKPKKSLDQYSTVPKKVSIVSRGISGGRRFSSSHLDHIENAASQPLKKIRHWIIKNKTPSENVTGQFIIGNPLLWANESNVKEFPYDMDIPLTQASGSWFDDGRPVKKTKNKKILSSDSTKKSRSRRNSGRRKTLSKATNGTLYCVCRKPYDARFMIACDRCNQWFHGECVGISEAEGEFIDLYFCVECSKVTGKTTSWKPRCANPACHQAARIGTNQGFFSKYCSDTCGLQVARARLELAQIKRRLETQDNIAVPEAMVARQRRSRINSLADLNDRQMLEKVQKEKRTVENRLIGLGRRHIFLEMLIGRHQNECGYDSRLSWPDTKWMQVQDIANGNGDISLKLEVHEPYDTCQRKICTKHLNWQKLILQQSERECGEQQELLDTLCGEWEQIAARIAKRRNAAEAAKTLSNATIAHSS